MKTRVFKFSGVLSLIMLVVGAVSCGSSMPSPKDVAEKIESHDVLAEADYTTMIDYCGEYAKKSSEVFRYHQFAVRLLVGRERAGHF